MVCVAQQAPLSMGFSRQEHWNGLPCSPPGDLPDPGIELVALMSPALAGGFFTISPTSFQGPEISFSLVQSLMFLVWLASLHTEHTNVGSLTLLFPF